MGRGESCGGGQSSLGYLFGSGEPPKPTPNSAPATPTAGSAVSDVPDVKPAVESQPASAGTNRSAANNYFRNDGDQNNGNFVRERPSTKVHSVPGGESSLDYLFGGGKN